MSSRGPSIWKKERLIERGENPEQPEQLIDSKIIDQNILTLQASLYESDHVSESRLRQCLFYFQQKHFDEVLIERHVNGMCALPTCGNQCRQDLQNIRFKISGNTRELYDTTIMKMYCSRDCLAKSIEWRNSISPESVYQRFARSLPTLDEVEHLTRDVGELKLYEKEFKNIK